MSTLFTVVQDRQLDAVHAALAEVAPASPKSYRRIPSEKTTSTKDNIQTILRSTSHILTWWDQDMMALKYGVQLDEFDFVGKAKAVTTAVWLNRPCAHPHPPTKWCFRQLDFSKAASVPDMAQALSLGRYLAQSRIRIPQWAEFHKCKWRQCRLAVGSCSADHRQKAAGSKSQSVGLNCAFFEGDV